MRKILVLLAIGCLIMFMTGCSGHEKPAPSAPASTTQSQQITTSQATVNPAPQSQGPLPVKERQLNSVASMLHAKANIPVLMPSYWPPVLSNNRDRYCGIQYSVGPDGYSATLTTVSKQLPVNSPELNLPPNDSEANQWENFGGVRIGAPGSSAPIVQQPADGQPSVIGGYQGWQDRLSFYWESGSWLCEVQNSSSTLMNDARSLTGSFKEAGELEGLRAKSGKILASDADHQHTFISWVSADGRYEYTLRYDGETADAIKIANSFSEVKQE
jgi:hypothetical protein